MLFCVQHPMAVGAGYGFWTWNQCVNENPQGCEWWGGMIYPKCRAGFYTAGCCICSPLWWVCIPTLINYGIRYGHASYQRQS